LLKVALKHPKKQHLWSDDSWIYNYLCNQYLSPVTLWIWIPLMAICTRYNILWYSMSVISGNKSYHHVITEILLKVALNTIKQINKLIQT
jgi:hypothetical protein